MIQRIIATLLALSIGFLATILWPDDAPAIIQELRALPEVARVDYSGPRGAAQTIIHIRDYHFVRGEMVAQAVGRMANGTTTAADVLRALLKAESETVRLGAARNLLDMGGKFREAVEYEQRVTALEERLIAGSHS